MKPETYWACRTKKHRHRRAIDAVRCIRASNRWYTILTFAGTSVEVEHPAVDFMVRTDKFSLNTKPDARELEEVGRMVHGEDLDDVRLGRYLLSIGVRGGARYG